ncbi:unnamed protein product [Lactuca virosa]|uniref:Uncharacterized protein n=1 Tax=Lactuca virosa TaxID=75947 RepID=A0AAU9M1I4_9ASTR|nr:unnamed protein product [Lactuca virosa]
MVHLFDLQGSKLFDKLMSNIVKIDIEDYICTYADQKTKNHLCRMVVNNNVESARVGGIYLEMGESALLLDGVF